MTINYFFQLHHRRLRERFGIEACIRHEVWIMRALEQRNAKLHPEYSI